MPPLGRLRGIILFGLAQTEASLGGQFTAIDYRAQAILAGTAARGINKVGGGQCLAGIKVPSRYRLKPWRLNQCQASARIKHTITGFTATKPRDRFSICLPVFTVWPELLDDEELDARPLEELLELDELLDEELDEDDELELLDEVRPELELELEL